MALLASGWASEAFLRPPTGQEGHLPPREVSLVPGGQNPISLEYQILSSIIDILVTGLVLEGSPSSAQDWQKETFSRDNPETFHFNSFQGLRSKGFQTRKNFPDGIATIPLRFLRLWALLVRQKSRGITHWVTPSPSTPSTPEAQKDKTVIKQCEQCEQWKQQCKECKQCNQLLARCSNNSIVVSFNGLIKCNLEGSFFVQLRFRRFVIVSDSYMLCN